MTPRFVRWILLLFAVFFAVIAFSSRSIQLQQPASAASQMSSVQIPGLREKVTIRRDERGIPYIQANNDHDLYLAQGYVTASDRLWQMDLYRRTQRGELAEILTAGPNNIALEQDKQHRVLGVSKVVEVELALATAESREMLEAYANGVNAYINSATSLPPEFQILQYRPKPWEPTDSLLIFKLFAEALSTTWRTDLMREALAALPAEKRAALLPEKSPLDVVLIGNDTRKAKRATAQMQRATPFSASALKSLAQHQRIAEQALARVGFSAEGISGSNNWVVSGKRTESGKPLLANDPHLPPSAPSIWYMVHLAAPGVRVAGVVAPGLPGIIIGHNNRIAWGMTNVGPDVQDLYVEKFDPANPRRYLTSLGWREAKIRREEIKVRKGFADLAFDTVPLDVTVTHHGPIVFERDGKRYALQWTALEPKFNNPASSHSMTRARNWQEFSTAVQSFTAPAQNIVYADVDGNIGYRVGGVIPIRRSGDGSVPYDGSTDAGDWTSFIPPAKLPHLFNPPSGVIVTANQRIVGDSYPYFLTRVWFQPYRAHRILELINQKPKLSINDFRRIQGDVYSAGNHLFARQVCKILQPELTPAETKLAQALDEFEKWDGRMVSDSSAAALVAQMRIAFRSRILTAALGDELVRFYAWSNFDTTIDRLITDQPKEWLPKEFNSYAGLLRATFDDARKALARNFGEDESKWRWGNLVQVRFPHPLAVAPLVGTQFTVSPFPQEGAAGLAPTVNLGSFVSMRFIADPGNWDQSQHGITLGQSGVPNSPHWSDQLQDWRQVTPRAFPFTEAAVAQATKQTLVLDPKK